VEVPTSLLPNGPAKHLPTTWHVYQLHGYIYHLLPVGQLRWIRTEPILNFSIRCSSVVSFTLQLLYSRDNASSTRWTWGWMVPRPVLDILGKKNLLPMFGIEPWFCVIWPIVNQFTERIITSIICVSTVALVLSWKQLLLHVEHSDLQGTYNEEIHVSEILDMVCDARSDENNSEQKRKLPLCVIMQRVVVVSYRCFRTTIGPIIRVQESLKLWGWNR